ncbi:MAG: hypothetical protein KF773_26230 [Deltaproteobacteria bacterium]|nr:hypothetical protein [Deltaproteobacteria bacterium]
MRAAVSALAVSASLFAGCIEPFEFDLDLGGGCDWQIFPGPCVDAAHPVAFSQDETALALGGAAPVGVLVLEGFQMTIRSSNPEVLEVREVAPGEFRMHGLAEGDAELLATDFTPDPRVFARHPMNVRPVAGARFAFGPAGAPLARLAALPGAREKVRVTALDAANQPLAGGDAVVELAFAGATRINLALTQQRLGADVFGLAPAFGFDVGVEFGAVGAATLTANVAGAAVATLPIDVIAAPFLVDLELGRPLVAGGVAFLGLVGIDDRSTPVAGLVGSWSVSPAGIVELTAPPQSGEVLVKARASGAATVTATLADRTVSKLITVE